MNRRYLIGQATAWLPLTVLLAACHSQPPDTTLHVACASNLTNVFARLAAAYEQENPAGSKVLASFGATSQLTQQIENGAPFDLFLAADTEHISGLQQKGFVSRQFLYAEGKLALYGTSRWKLSDLKSSRVRSIAIASPALAPFGRASVEALERSGLWPLVKQRVVYTHTIAEVKAFVDTGNADAGLTALSLVPFAQATEIDRRWYSPLTQAGCILKRTVLTAQAESFARFMISPGARNILQNAGYGVPALK